MKMINYDILSRFNSDFTKTWNKLIENFQANVLLMENDIDW